MFTTEQIARSLLREFLIRRNMHGTVKQFDLEFQENLPSISRLDLIKSLCMERLVKINKERALPRNTLLEMLIDYLYGKSHNSEGSSPKKFEQHSKLVIEVQSQQLDQEETQAIYPPQERGSRLKNLRKAPSQEQGGYQITQKQQVVETETQKIDKEESFIQQTNPKQEDVQIVDENPQQRTQQEHIKDDFNNDLDDLDALMNFSQQKREEPREEERQPKGQQQQPSRMMNLKRKAQEPQQAQSQSINYEDQSANNTIQNTDIQEIQYEKIDLEQPYNGGIREQDKEINITYTKTVTFQQDNRKRKQQPQPIDFNTLQLTKKLIFANSGFNALPKSWAQGFILQNQKTFYGLLQREGGPCGVIASVQAYYLKHFLILGKGNSQSDVQFKTNCLVAAMADILYKAAKNGSGNIIITVASRPSGSNEAITLEACDQLVYPARSIQQTYEHLSDLKDLYIGETNHGVTLLFYSVILSKGIDFIKREMDNEENALIGNHGHCTQEMVNLLLTGRAVSNCFDGDKTLDEDYILRGVPEKSEFGFLTIFEHFKYMEVGQNLKTPYYPIWILCKEYHYSVIFATKSYALINTSELEQSLKEFDLIFFDELYAPDDFIRLTIRRNGKQKQNQKKQMVMGNGLTFNLGDDENLTPSLEMVLRTKWGPDIEVDWNDSMPIL